MSNRYRVRCTTDDVYRFVEQETEPTECPDDPLHSINAALTAIVEAPNDQAFDAITANQIDVAPSGDVMVGAVMADQDMEFLNNGDGTIVRDKATGTKYRIIVDNGVLKKEAV